MISTGFGVRRGLWVALGALATLSFSATASAQQQPLPNLPPPPPPPPSSPQPAAPPQQQPPPGYYQAPPNGPPNVYYAPAPPPAYQPPPAMVYIEPEPPTHAPKYSLWVGGRLSYLGFGGNFYTNQQQNPETTGNFVKNGPALSLDIGARLSRRYIPYVGIELAKLPAGHRFDGESNVSASSSFAGIGFRYIGGDVDTAGFLTDLSFGIRSVSVSSGNQTYTMTAIELFRLGLGAEIRLSTLLTLSPLFMISGGVMSDTQGTIGFGPNQADGISAPTYINGQPINNQNGYLVVSLGCGVHFDVFGK